MRRRRKNSKSPEANYFHAIKKKGSRQVKQLLVWIVAFSMGLGFIGLSWMAYEKQQIDLPKRGDTAHFYSDQTKNDLGELMYEAINAASESIYIEIYSLTDKKVIKLLKKKAKAGVRVEIVTDKRYSTSLRRKLGSGIVVVRGNGSGLMHRKVVVIDESQVWFGSSNFTWESLNMHHNLMVGLESPALARLLSDASAHTSGEAIVGGQNIQLWNLPQSNEAIGSLLNSINQASKSTYVAMFTWTRTDLAEALVNAKRRGVDVKVVMDRSMAQGASENIYRYLKANKIPVRLSQGPQLMHHKFLWIDEQEFYMGSLNWTLGGFSKNRDLLVRFPILSLGQEKFMKELWKINWWDSVE